MTESDRARHDTPWFHATDLPNVPPKNLVQIGIGGCQAPRPGVKGCERGWLDPGGFRPREVLKFIQLFAEPPLAGIEAVEARLVHAGRLPRRHGD